MDSQKTLGLIGELPHLRQAPEAEIRICKRMPDAMFETIRRSGRPRKAIEADTGISSSHMSRILEGSRTLPDRKRQAFFEACQNVYALEVEAYRLGFRLVRRDLTAEEEVEILRDRLAQYERDKGCA